MTLIIEWRVVTTPIQLSFFRSLDSESESDYIVLENLTQDFRKPCVLDLKMGTRMYGDFASEAKRQSQKRKSMKSTSAKLGLRFCGSQRFSVTKNNFERLDKYVGRKATEPEFRELLTNFFNNNGFLRRDIIRLVAAEVGAMRGRLEDLNQYRFYSSSLLIIYEGTALSCLPFPALECEDSLDGSEEFPGKQQARVKVKIIDFANSSVPACGEGEGLHEGPDRGFLLGLENLQEILESLMEEEPGYPPPRIRKP